MTYEIYRYIFLGGAILAGIMLVVSVCVFFRLKIPSVIGDLTGSNARKAIENIRKQNARAGEKIYRPSLVNQERGRITDKMSPSGRIMNSLSSPSVNILETGRISTQKLHAQAGSDKAAVQIDNGVSGNETTILGQERDPNATTILGQERDPNATTVLGNDHRANETTVLNAQSSGQEFFIEYEITYVHTAEVIA